MAQRRDEDAVTGAIERCYNRCKSEVEVRGANRDENNSDVLAVFLACAVVAVSVGVGGCCFVY